MLGAPVDGLSPEILYVITLENNVSYNLAVNQSVIMRYVEVIPIFTPIFLGAACGSPYIVFISTSGM